jgi:hypothetical protein
MAMATMAASMVPESANMAAGVEVACDSDSPELSPRSETLNGGACDF